jgi:hypothetical protein
MDKCPHCKQQILSINLEEVVSQSVVSNSQWRTLIYSCPSCQCAISVSIDPIAIKINIVNEILNRQ